MIFLAGKVTIVDLLILAVPALAAVLLLAFMLARPSMASLLSNAKALRLKKWMS